MSAWCKSVLYILCFINQATKTIASDFHTNDFTRSLFPENFIFGTTSQIKITRARNESGRSESIWDWLTDSYPMAISSGTNVELNFDSYYKYKDEVLRIKDIGFGMYKFSLPWPRILPNGSSRLVNSEELRYYQSLLDELQANGIQAMIVLHDGDLPGPIHNIGGWLNPLAVKYFEDYARLVFENLGAKVKWWITIKEPTEVAKGYGSRERVPGLNLHGYGEYKAGHNLLRAHARVYRIYKNEFASKQGGKISMSLKGDFIFPATDTEEDQRAAETAMQFTVGWFGHPVFSAAGDYPPVMRDYIDRNSAIEGLKQSRLPYFNKTEVQEIRGSFDFIAVNHETSYAASFSKIGLSPSWNRDKGVKLFKKFEWNSGSCLGANIGPKGFRNVLNYFKDEYGESPVIVARNGYCDNGDLTDEKRIFYLKEYLLELIKAIKEDGCKVIGYCANDLVEGVESRNQLSFRKLHQVNVTQTTLLRKKKLSTIFWKHFLSLNSNLAK